MTYSDLSWDLSAPSNDRGGKGMGIRLKHGGGAQVEELTTSWLSSQGPNIARVERARYWRRGEDCPPPPPLISRFFTVLQHAPDRNEQPTYHDRPSMHAPGHTRTR